MNDRKVERVARAICNEALRPEHPPFNKRVNCPECIDGQCQMWPQFKGEAIAALKASKGF